MAWSETNAIEHPEPLSTPKDSIFTRVCSPFPMSVVGRPPSGPFCIQAGATGSRFRSNTVQWPHGPRECPQWHWRQSPHCIPPPRLGIETRNTRTLPVLISRHSHRRTRGGFHPHQDPLFHQITRSFLSSMGRPFCRISTIEGGRIPLHGARHQTGPVACSLGQRGGRPPPPPGL